jgi:NCS1 family nucleobase:cation symporter-1
VNAVSGLEVAVTWRRFFQISFFFGYAISGSLYYLFNKLSPPPGLGVQVDFDIDGSALVIEGIDSESEKHADYGKQMGDVQTKSEN